MPSTPLPRSGRRRRSRPPALQLVDLDLELGDLELESFAVELEQRQLRLGGEERLGGGVGALAGGGDLGRRLLGGIVVGLGDDDGAS